MPDGQFGKDGVRHKYCETVGVDLGLPVLVFSLEVSASQAALRFLASRAHVDLAKLRQANLTDGDWERLTESMSKLHPTPIDIDKNGMITINELRARARRIHLQHGQLGLVVIGRAATYGVARGHIVFHFRCDAICRE